MATKYNNIKTAFKKTTDEIDKLIKSISAEIGNALEAIQQPATSNIKSQYDRILEHLYGIDSILKASQANKPDECTNSIPATVKDTPKLS